jgi:dolichyl-phosphate beta-glucosyltransferase
MKDKIKSISYVIPVYNEQKRLKILLKEILFFKKKYKKIDSEFIVINDGSDDKSYQILKKAEENYKFIRLINLQKNYGKGYALRKGVINAKKNFIVTIDADLSVKFNQTLIWFNKYKINSKNTVYFASRNHKLSKVKFKFHRKFIGLILSLFVYFFVDKSLKDTQCGFKLYSNKIAKKIFKRLTTKGFSHDIEIIFILKKMNKKIYELPVNWIHRNNSKVNLITEPFKFIANILLLKIKYF